MTQTNMLDRNLYKIQSEDQSSVGQSIDLKPTVVIDNFNKLEFYKTSNFPQPAIVGMGYVTSGGAKDTTAFFKPNTWTVSRSSAGVYVITHNISEIQVSGATIKRYLPMINLIGSTDKSFVVTVGATTTTVYTFNQAGTATDTAFMFVFYLIS
jgi:hypothetical protein